MLPVETIAATFPIGGTGRFRLRAVALCDVVMLEALGVDCDAAVTPDRAMVAAWVLSSPPGALGGLAWSPAEGAEAFARWEAGHREWDPAEVAREVDAALNRAWSTFIPPRRDRPGGEEMAAGMRTGLGWPLEYGEWIASEYGIPFDEAMRTPVIRAFALSACARTRNGGGHGGPDYFERIAVGRMRRAKAEKRAAAGAAEAKGDGEGR